MTLLTTAQAAEALGITPQAVRMMVLREQLPSTKFGRDLAFDAADIEKAKSRPKRGRPAATAAAGTLPQSPHRRSSSPRHPTSHNR